MADVDDIHNVSAQVERQHEKLDRADIDDRDRDAIKRFVRHRRVNADSYADHTQVADLSKLRLSATRADSALVDMTIDDVNALFDALARPTAQGGFGVTSDSGLDGYGRALRVFFKWLDTHADEPAYPWFEEISASRHSLERYDPDDQLSIDEVAAIKEAARQGDNTARDRAIVAFFADAAVRLSLGGQLRVGDLDLDADRPTFSPNPNGNGQKGVDIRPYPLYDCVADLRVWVNTHHPDPRPEAPLWTREGYDPDNPSEGALSSQRLGGVIRDCTRRAGIEKPSNPHNFRHSKIADMRAREYTPDQIQRRVAWQDSVVADMMTVYGRPDDEQTLANIDEREGRDPADADETTTEPPQRQTCGMCGLEDIAPEANHCPQCGDALSADARRAEAGVATLKGDSVEQILNEFDTSGLTDEQLRGLKAILRSTDEPRVLAPVLIEQFS